MVRETQLAPARGRRAVVVAEANARRQRARASALSSAEPARWRSARRPQVVVPLSPALPAVAAPRNAQPAPARRWHRLAVARPRRDRGPRRAPARRAQLVRTE